MFHVKFAYKTKSKQSDTLFFYYLIASHTIAIST